MKKRVEKRVIKLTNLLDGQTDIVNYNFSKNKHCYFVFFANQMWKLMVTEISIQII